MAFFYLPVSLFYPLLEFPRIISQINDLPWAPCYQGLPLGKRKLRQTMSPSTVLYTQIMPLKNDSKQMDKTEWSNMDL